MPYGTARPRSLIRKSCTRTSSGWPWGCHSRPPFLKSPTSSFFFVSTEITGCCSARAAETLWLMSANWASRSGWLLPSLVLRLACRLNFCCFSSSPTTVWLIRWPRAASSLASRRRLLQVQRSGDIGSPRSLGATSASRSSSRAASVATRGLRPPPGRRTRSASSWATVASSFKPRPIVLTAMPVARDTAAIPPYPAVRASVAANSRRLRSSRWGNSKVKRARMPVGSIIPTRYGITPLPRIQPSAPIHLFPDNHLESGPIAREGAGRRSPQPSWVRARQPHEAVHRAPDLGLRRVVDHMSLAWKDGQRAVGHLLVQSTGVVARIHDGVPVPAQDRKRHPQPRIVRLEQSRRRIQVGGVLRTRALLDGVNRDLNREPRPEPGRDRLGPEHVPEHLWGEQMANS